MEQYISARNEAFKGHQMHERMRDLAGRMESLVFVPSTVFIRGSIGQGNWATVPWLALMDKRITSSTRDGVYVCYLFSDDMSHCYLTIARGVTNTIEKIGRRKAYELFQDQNVKDRAKYIFTDMTTDDDIHLSSHGLGRDYEASVIAYIKYERDLLPSNDQLILDLETVMRNYQQYVTATLQTVNEEKSDYHSASKSEAEVVEQFLQQTEEYIASQGFYYSRELLSILLLSLKVRPFVILAGISGTGKSKIAAQFARTFGSTRENGRFLMIPVRPDWSDPSDLLGYRDLKGDFVPGPLTDLIERASKDPSHPYFVLIDEMNLARVEYYLSDVLSVIETQRWENGKIVSDPLIQMGGLNERDRNRYGELTWPSNVMLIGTVNMDETTHSISKKVVDRATTIEFNAVDLSLGIDTEQAVSTPPSVVINGLLDPEYLVLKDIQTNYRSSLDTMVENLTHVNRILQSIGAHIGYRVRDVISFFVVYSERLGLFSQDEAFDIQLVQKILPRIQGSSASLRRSLFEMLQFSVGRAVQDEPDAYLPWLPGENQAEARFPRTAGKTADMLRRLDEDGFTSYWLT